MGFFAWGKLKVNTYEQSSTKLAPLRAASLNKIPLLATIPTSFPKIVEKPQINDFP